MAYSRYRRSRSAFRRAVAGDVAEAVFLVGFDAFSNRFDGAVE